MYIAKVDENGQITIPREYINKLDADYYILEVKNDEIILKPVKSLAGALEKYAKKGKDIEKIMNEEEKALEIAFVQKHSS
mgnify:CR=1 FL=1